MYFTYNGSAGINITGGHNVVGATAPAGVWDFAEGFTGTGFDEYLTIHEPRRHRRRRPPSPTSSRGRPTPTSQDGRLPANSRTTVVVHETSDGNPAGSGAAWRTRRRSRPMSRSSSSGRCTSITSATTTGGHNVIGAAAEPAVCMAALRQRGRSAARDRRLDRVGAVRLTHRPGDRASSPASGSSTALTANITAAHIHEGSGRVRSGAVSGSTSAPLAPTRRRRRLQDDDHHHGGAGGRHPGQPGQLLRQCPHAAQQPRRRGARPAHLHGLICQRSFAPDHSGSGSRRGGEPGG